jgi:hypothetical protein
MNYVQQTEEVVQILVEMKTPGSAFLPRSLPKRMNCLASNTNARSLI